MTISVYIRPKIKYRLITDIKQGYQFHFKHEEIYSCISQIIFMHVFHQFLKIFKTVGYAFLELSQRRGVVLLLRLKVYILIAEDYEFH